MTDKIKEAITEHWGERCDDFDADCVCCQAWKEWDDLQAELADCKSANNDNAF